jgi:putative chitinase
MDRKKFFDTVRKTVFNGKLTGQQVAGMEAILDACDEYVVSDLKHRASMLATPMIETGGSFEPIVESLNYKASALVPKFGKRITQAQANKYGRIDGKQVANQEAIGNIIYGGEWGKKNLGNVTPNIGYRLRGRGLVQLTGERLYLLGGKLIGEDLIANPDLACELKRAAKLLVVGERDGIFTGYDLSDFLGPNKNDWKNARRIVNGTDRADDLAVDSKKFYSALLAAA